MRQYLRLLALVLALIALPTHAATVLVTGANRGLGLEFARQYAAREWTVIATTREPDTSADLRALAASQKNVIVEQLDVSDTKAIQSLAAKYRGTTIDVLINNAGVLGDLPAQTLGTLSAAEFQRVMMVNAFAPLAMAEAFRDHIAGSQQKKIVAISSGNASVSRPSVPGGLYFYRASKTALNALMRSFASDVAKQGIAVGIISPGGVDTDMGRQAGGATRPQNMPASQSAVAVMKVIDGLTPRSGNVFFRYDGTIQPW